MNNKRIELGKKKNQMTTRHKQKKKQSEGEQNL